VLYEGYDLPMPRINVLIADFLVDAVWHEAKLAVEVDGGPAHTGAGAVEDDRRRDLVLREHGFLVVRYTWHQLTEQREAIARDLGRALGRNGPTIPRSRGEVAEWLKALAC
jgi:very-short-patch-repair endonuclease